jgi:hypothetical protein
VVASATGLAAAASHTFSGYTSVTMGGVAQGTPFSGTFRYDPAALAPGGSIAYYGGTKTVYPAAYSELSLTIGANTVQEIVPGAIALFNDVSPPHSIPVGDSFYSFDPLSGAPNRSTGSFAGLTPNFIYLGLVDSSGAVFTGPSLPGVLHRADFTAAFIGVNYGPFGTGNTTTISNLVSLSPVPEPAAALLMLAGLAAVAAARRGARA